MNIRLLDSKERQRSDCTVVALAICADLDYKTAANVMKKFGRKDNEGSRNTKRKITTMFKSLGFKATQVKRSGRLDTFLNSKMPGVFYCLKRGHAFAVINGHTINQEAGCILNGAWKIEEAN